MGVTGLLPLLRSIHKHTTLKTYAGQTLGVDAFGWLHRGAVACSFQLAFDKPTTQYVSFVVNRVRMLLDFGVTPYLVFDGDALPSKAGTNTKRKQDRDTARELGMSLWRSGKKEQALQELQKTVSITPQMIFAVIEELRRMNVQVLVAPYEADAQLAYLEKEGIIDGILSEDSDLLVFGAQKLITKLDQHGACVEVNRADFTHNKDISFAGWSDSMFRRMAILSGCDYLPSINGIGLKKGHEFVKKHKEISKITRVMAMQGKYIVPVDYASKFIDAERAFLYHRVFCPKLGKLVFLNPIPPDLKVDDMPYLGAYVDPEVAVGIACGDLDPKTKLPFGQAVQRLKGTIITPRPLNDRRQTVIGSGDLKPKRSIDSFFQPQRTPLAELDPNSLTPSPSQQRILERNRNAGWEPRLANSAPPLRRHGTDYALPQSGLLGNSVTSDRMGFLARAGAVSAHQPVKRQRMCSAADDVSPSKEVKQSKYFAPNTANESPSVKKVIREQRQRKKGAFDIFADDSEDNIIDRLLMSNPDADTSRVTYPELPKLTDHESALVEDEFVPQSSPAKPNTSFVDSQSSHGTVELEAFSFGTESGTQAEVDEHKQPKAFADLLEFHVQNINNDVRGRSLARTFSHQSPDRQSAALASLKGSTRDTGNADHGRSLSSKAVPESTAEVLASPQPASSTKFQNLARTFACQSSEVQIQAFESLRKVTAPLHRAQLAPFTGAVGSEDNIPFSSQDELSEPEEPAASFVNLKRFQYVG